MHTYVHTYVHRKQAVFTGSIGAMIGAFGYQQYEWMFASL